MKRKIFSALFLAGLCASGLKAEDTPADIAARQETDDRIKTMAARMEDLQHELQSYKQALMKLNEEVRNLHDEIAKSSNNGKDAATQESLKQLARSIEEVDKKRVADNDRTAKILKEYENILLARASSTPRAATNPVPMTSNKPPGDPVKTGPENGYEYAIRQGDTLSGIVSALGKQGIKVTMKQVTDANPGVNWNRLRVGQKIFIPAPAKT